MKPTSFVVPYGRQNASVRARTLHWVERSHGTDNGQRPTVYGPGFLPGVPRPGSNVVLLRNVRRFSRGAAERRLLKDASFGVYEIDDGLPWDDGKLEGLGRVWKRPWPRSRIALAAARAADRVIAGNDVLAGWAEAHCRDVHIIPTCVEPNDYRRKASYAVADRPKLGWLGSPATEPYLFAVSPALAEVNRRTGAQLEIVSASGSVPREMQSFTTRIPWTESLARTQPSEWDVGLMPLPDDVYAKAKCGYKLLQYWCAGLPAIGSPVGANTHLLAQSGSSAPTTIDDWVDAIESLLTSGDEDRAALGARGLRVAADFSYDAWQTRWSAAVSPTSQ